MQSRVRCNHAHTLNVAKKRLGYLQGTEVEQNPHPKYVRRNVGRLKRSRDFIFWNGMSLYELERDREEARQLIQKARRTKYSA